MRLWQKLLLSYVVIIGATVLVTGFALRSADDIKSRFARVDREVIPHIIALKDLRYSGLRIVSSTMEYAFLHSVKSLPDGNHTPEGEDEKNEEVRLIDEGREEFRRNLALCEAMLAAQAGRDRNLSVEQAGTSLIAASQHLLRLVESGAAPGKLLEQKEAFEKAEQAFIATVNASHDYEMGILRRQVSDSFDSVASAVRSTGFLSIAAIAFSLALGLFISLSISRRISLIKRAAGDVALGKRDVAVPITSNDEITSVSISFNDMVEKLWDSEEEIDAINRYLDSIIVTMPEALSVVSLDGSILDINQATEQVLGLHKESLVGKEFVTLFRDQAEGQDFMDLVLGAAGAVEREATFVARDGREVHVILSATMLESKGKKDRFLCLSRDITQRKQAELEVHNLAYFDQLTGLANRTLFYDRCSQALSRAQRDQDMFAVLFIDLDDFKIVNDTMGHDCGDLLLQLVVQRLKSCVRACDTLARLGGDEFALLCTSVAGPEGAATVAEKLLSLMKEPFMVENRQVYTGASIGIVIFPDDGADIGVLLRNADLAMYAAKSSGGNRFQFYSMELNRKAQERSDIEEALRKALQKGELSLHYQPQLDLVTGELIGMEALARWYSGELGAVSPTRFIPVAEQTGLIQELGRWVLETATAQCKEWHRQGHEITMSVNVSIKQLASEQFAETVAGVLLDAGLEPEFLDLELTESILMEDAPHSVALLKTLKSLGVKISIDDFGTGYSSLSYLKNFSIDRIKIDQSFVRDIATRQDSMGIVKAIVALGHSMGLKLIAEGVETRYEAEALKSCRCDEVQGYLYARPMPAEEATEYLAKARAKVLTRSCNAPSTLPAQEVATG